MIDLFVIFTFSLFLSLAVRSFHSTCISKSGLLTILLWADYVHSLIVSQAIDLKVHAFSLYVFVLFVFVLCFLFVCFLVITVPECFRLPFEMEPTTNLLTSPTGSGNSFHGIVNMIRSNVCPL